ncbi:hypothetical protein V3C99_004654 [Haemonchus contortus]
MVALQFNVDVVKTFMM